MKVIINPETFERIKSDTQFIRLMHLCRYANQLRFCFGNYVQDAQNDSPAEIHKRFNGFFIAGAVMFEALKLIPSLVEVFRDFEASKTFKAICDDSEVKEFRDSYLGLIRNKLVFHVDRGPIRDTLKWIEFDEYVIASIDESTVPETTYFQLADDIAVNFIMGDHTEFQDENERQRIVLEEVLNTLARCIAAFNKATYELVYQYGSANGFLLRNTGDPAK